ncbi:hypothetical protein MMC18_000916 [Xylographa bjoerkii]|nr:hypothetical protein [Xylographa bjoerkii]
MAATTSHRAWEIGNGPSNSNTTPRGQLPSITALTNAFPSGPGSNGLPSPASTRERDSGAWSSQPQSTRSSAYSTSTGYQPSSNTNSYYMSPTRISNISNSSQLGATSHPMEYSHTPTSASALSSPGFAPPSSLLPSLNQVHDPSRQSQEFPPQESRRSSLGSQVNQGLNGLHINGTGSPYTGSVNHSTTSLAQNLSRERGITNANGARNSRTSGQLPMSPLSPHESESRMPTSTPRIAPPIGRNPRSDIYNAFEPAPGQAYAFPDPPDVQPGDLPPIPGKRATSSAEEARSGIFSRRDSGHTSITSSIVTSDSHLPPGQRRLEEGDMPGTHHHTLQQAQLTDLNGESPMSTEDGITPYSRTPALRVSHKMAERKRRSEMKDLFENLRSQIPSNQGSKSSKWEILTKASEYIKALEASAQNGQHADKQLRLACHDLEMSRRDNDSLRDENQRLLHDIQVIRQAQATHQQPTTTYPASHQYGPPLPSLHDPSRSLPPLTTSSAPSSSMQGVQYSSHDHR